MFRQDFKALRFAVFLTMLAGYTDAIGFLQLGGVFVSFMSGNSTRLAVGMTRSDIDIFWPGMIILLFVTGVIVGTAIGHHAGRIRSVAILSFVTLMLLTASGLALFAHSSAAVVCAVMSMGAINTVFEKDGEAKTGITYMTGNLVKLGQRIAALLWGGRLSECVQYAVLWVGLILGVVLGSSVFHRLGLVSLGFAALFSAALTLAAIFRTRRDMAED